MPDYAAKPKDKKKLLQEVRECYKKATEADQENRRQAMDCIKFARVPNSQWDDQTKTDRGKDRLMLEFNKTKVQCKRVINEMRQNRPQGKIRGYEDNDKPTAEVMEGLARNIWNVSKGDSISDYQAEYQVFGGYGVWEIVTDYSSDTAFDQDIIVRNVPNPFCIWSDPASKDMLKQDADWWLKTDKIRKTAYEARWPKRDVCDFEDTEFDDEEEWADDELVRICEYWYKVPATKEIALLQDGKTVDVEKDQPAEELIVKRRTVKCHKIMTLVCSGDAILEGPSEWAGKHFPFVPVYGDYLLIDGKIHWSGMVVDLKDAQRAYNSHRTNIVEIVESAAKSTDWATPEQAKGHEKMWAEAHKKNFPFRLFNVDPKNPGPPVRTPGAEVPVANMQAAQIASEEMNSLAGFVFDPSGGEAQNISGKALNARAKAGQIATFNYPDNMGKAMQLTWEILIDLIPKIYDTQRSIRILGADGAEKFVQVNQPDETGKVMNDLSRGKYDVTVTIGPSYATQRQESTEVFMEMGRAMPQIWGVAGDIIARNLDVPGGEQLAKRLETLLPEPIQKQLTEGKDLPPEVMAAMAKVEQAGAALQQQSQLVQAAQAEIEGEKSEATKAKSEVQIAIANLKTEEAKFQTMQANFETMVAKTQADLQKTVNDIQVSEIQHETDKADAEKVGNAANMAIDAIQSLSEAIRTEFQEMLGTAAQVVMAAKQEIPKPRPVKISARRVNGALTADLTYDDGNNRSAELKRGPNGEMEVGLQ